MGWEKRLLWRTGGKRSWEWADRAVRSQAKEESSGEGSGRVLNFEGVLSLARRI
jgi:hypothetical protein